MPAQGRLLGMDWGTRRIGLALSDPTQTLAQPLGFVTRRTGRRFPLRQLRAHLEVHQPVGIVLGLPLTPGGQEGVSAKQARVEGRLIEEKTGLPLVYIDERMTTARARRAVREMGGTSRGREGEIDQLAATLLLQAFLDRRAR